MWMLGSGVANLKSEAGQVMSFSLLFEIIWTQYVALEKF